MFTNQLTAAIQKEKMLKEMEEEKRKAEKEREKAEIAKLEAEEAKSEIEAINSLARSINENLELKFIMDKIMNFVELHYEIKFYSLHILNDSKKKMKLLEAKFPENVTSEEKRKITQILIPIETQEGAFAFICKSKKMVFYKKLDIEKSNEEERQALGNLNISSMVGIPLKVKNEIIGILNFFSPTQLSLTKMHLRTIASLGDQVAGVIHNSSLYKDIKSEKDKSESLLLSILPPKIAMELKNTSKVVPIIYESVTILFTDFVGFTKIAESLLPKQLLIELDGYFTFFDFVCEKYNIEKLKTIGDAYMCAGGLPTANKTHALDACLTAMEFRDFALRMQELNLSSKDEMMPWELRIGLHTGSVIGGIVGTTKFAYDVWGDSVNIASRIESSSVPGKINISETTYELVKEFFVCEHRGKVSAKNKGEIHMYFLDRLRPELSANEDGTAPNQKFHELYAKVKAGESIESYSIEQLPLAV
jgi:class 3 adenylate cyclase